MSRPNILLIHCHDLGRHLGCYGVDNVVSPHLDALAAQGVRATSMFAAAPQCSPSRAALFTGRWPHANGVMGLTHRSFAWDLHPEEKHLAQLLRAGGYRSELIGVHHESRAASDEVIAERLGFDRVRTGGLAEVVAERGVEALYRFARSDEPFYLQVGFLEPHRLPGHRDEKGVMGFLGDHLSPDTSRGVHVPGYLVDDDTARAELAELQGAIRAMDAAVGSVLRALDHLDLAEDTITIFTTDHGLALPRAKCSLYDPGLEIAFIARWPAGGWSGGSSITGALSNIDVAPTLLEAVGPPAGPGRTMHGESFAAALAGEQPTFGREHVFAEMTYHDYYDPRRCVRTDELKLIANFSSAPGYMDPSQSWRRRCTPHEPSYAHEDYHPSLELYDLRNDPWEQHDLAEDPSNFDRLADLSEQLFTWMQRTGDPLHDGPVGNPLATATRDRLWASTLRDRAAPDAPVMPLHRS